MKPGWRLIGLAAALALGASGRAEAESGRLLGWVEDTEGAPVAGAVISLFGKGIDGGGLVTLSDSAGRFFLPSLPAGSYTLRALWTDRSSAVARQVTVLPNQDSVFTLNLEASQAADTAGAHSDDEEPEALRELRWLLRHKRRSVLEQREDDTLEELMRASFDAPAAAAVDPIGGALEVVANQLGDAAGSAGGADGPAGTGVLRLSGRLTDNVTWSLAGLVAESESTTWRAASEFLIEPGAGHMIQAGAGYGTRLLRPRLEPVRERGNWENRSVGAMFLRDTFEIGDRVTASLGGRYSYIGFLDDANHFDPTASLEFRADDGTRIRGAFAVQTVAPGGDMLTVSSLAVAPDMVFAVVQDELRAERVSSSTVEIVREVGDTTVGTHGFFERVEDQLVNVASGDARARTLRIVNGGSHTSRGGGFTLGRRFGHFVKGSITYTYGRALWDGAQPGRAAAALMGFEKAAFHDIVGRLETVLAFSGTRLAAFYRINSLDPESDGAGGQSAIVNTRFDVQLTQGLPFLAQMTRADWELLFAYRNLFYEESEGALLDEIAVVDPPRRIVGGIAIKF